MENKIVTKSLRRQLDQVILHEQMENGTTVSNNLNVDQVNQWFETPRRVFQIEHIHLWIEERLVGHKTLQAALIILCEVQTGEAQRHTNSLL